MAYNILDLIDRALNISEKILLLYENVIKDEKPLNSYHLLIATFVKYRWKKIKYYNDLRTKLKSESIQDIDFSIYDKISSLISEFNNNLVYNWNNTTKSFMEWVIHTNKNGRALLIDIRGRLMSSSPKEFKLEYSIITDIIDMEENYILDLQNTYKDLYGN